jgi:hypothetical protein
VAVAPDGSWVVTTGYDGVRIWDAATGVPLPWTALGHRAHDVTKVAVAPDGTRLATVSGDGSVWIWDAVCGRAVGMTRIEHAGLSCAWGPIGQTLFVGGNPASTLSLSGIRGARHQTAHNRSSMAPSSPATLAGASTTAYPSFRLSATSSQSTNLPSSRQCCGILRGSAASSRVQYPRAYPHSAEHAVIVVTCPACLLCPQKECGMGADSGFRPSIPRLSMIPVCYGGTSCRACDWEADGAVGGRL